MAAGAPTPAGNRYDSRNDEPTECDADPGLADRQQFFEEAADFALAIDDDARTCWLATLYRAVKISVK